MKGQYLTIEYVLFFAIGVAMIIIVYTIFSGLNTSVTGEVLESQLERIGELIRGNIVNIFDASENNRIVYNLSIPTKLSGCVYTVSIDQNNLILDCIKRNISSSLSLYNIYVNIENIIYSTRGFVQIEANNYTVELK
jgi:hypothetical protein